ncbi:Rpn family recombination-promoting nuclease/putative transposase, partial [Limosilactobacillus kribbianus]|uniref:Rpn family recombination-promoting nuclease/putative transposase n=1 Tax=Limosilactobacillus kribbianus TaxID=2982695 RepID=UPI002263D433
MTHSTNQEAELRAKWEHLTLANDRMFGMVMEDDQICLELLHRIFPRLDIKHIQRVTTQKQVNTTLGIKAPRFDAYVRDDQNRTYILEMQVKNNHNLPFRMRYYMNHADVLRPGDSYDEQHVNPIYVIFFCDFDYYGDGAMAYEFEMRSVRNPAR